MSRIDLIMTNHFTERMATREISNSEVLNTFYFGDRMKGKNYDKTVRNLFYDRKSRIILVASHPKEVLVTCFKFKDDKSFDKKLNEYKTLKNNLDYSSPTKPIKTKYGDKVVWRDELKNSIQLRRS